MSLYFALLAAFGLFTPRAGAQKSTPKGFHGSLGAGVAFKNNIRKDNLDERADSDPIVVPVPFASFGWGPVQLKGQGLEATLLNLPLFGLSATFSRFGDSYEAEGMSRRKPSFFAGASLRLYKLNIGWKKDIRGYSNGSLLDLTWNQALPALFGSHIFPSLRIGAEYWNQKLLSYYYGVRPNEVTPERPLYNPPGDWAYVLGLNFIIRHNKHFTSIVGPNYKNYGKRIDQSPTTIKNDEISLFYATFYSF